jgi:hypothetical protein
MLSLSQCRPEDDNSALFFDRCRYLMISKNSFWVILCGSTVHTFRKNSGSLEVDPVAFLQVYSFLPCPSLGKNCREVME